MYTGCSKASPLRKPDCRSEGRLVGVEQRELAVLREHSPQTRVAGYPNLHLLYKYFCFKTLPVMENRAPSFLPYDREGKNKLLLTNFPFPRLHHESMNPPCQCIISR